MEDIRGYIRETTSKKEMWFISSKLCIKVVYESNYFRMKRIKGGFRATKNITKLDKPRKYYHEQMKVVKQIFESPSIIYYIDGIYDIFFIYDLKNRGDFSYFDYGCQTEFSIRYVTNVDFVQTDEIIKPKVPINNPECKRIYNKLIKWFKI